MKKCILVLLFLLESVSFSQISTKLLLDFKAEIKMTETVTRDSLGFLEFEFIKYKSTFTLQQKYVIYYGLAWEYDFKQDYTNALYYANMALSCAESMNKKGFIADALQLIAQMEFRLRVFDEALNNYKKALSIYEELNDSTMQCVTTLGTAISYSSLDKDKESLEAFRNAVRFANLSSKPKLKTFVYQNVASSFIRFNEPDSALYYLKMCNDLRAKSDTDDYASEREKAFLCDWYAKVYTDKGEHELAISYLDTAFRIANKYNLPGVFAELYKTQSKLNESLGEWKSVSNDLKKHIYYKDSLENIVSVSELLAWNTAQEANRGQRNLLVERQKVLKLSHDSEIKSLTNKITVLIGVLIIFGITFFFWRYRVKEIKKKEVLRKQLDLEKVQAKLKVSELKNQELLNEQLNQQLEYKKEDLLSLSLDIARRNEFAQRTLELVKEISLQDAEEARAKKQELILYLTQQKSINAGLKDIQENIEVANKEFVAKLTASFPNLTSSDVLICSLYKIGLSNKDIASVKGVSTSSVEMSRYRLRKKLNLNPEDDLLKYLSNI